MVAEHTPQTLDALICDAPEWTDPTVTPSLAPEMLPEPLVGWLQDVAALNCVPLETVAAPAIVGLAAVVGTSIGIMPDRYSDHLMVPNLWGAHVARPGQMKSATMQAGLAPVMRIDVERREQAKELHEQNRAELQRIRAEIRGIEKAIETAGAEGNTAALHALQERLAPALERESWLDAPTQRLTTSDATVEKLGILLAENPRGLLLQRDELSGWLSSLDKKDRAGDREFYLEAWEGARPYTVDRVGRGTLFIPSLTLSLFGTMQPGKLERYVRDAMSGGAGDDGLLQRIQVFVWPDRLPLYHPPSRFPDATKKDRAFTVYRTLADLDAAEFGAQVQESRTPYLRFGCEAQGRYDRWRTELERRLRSGELDQRPAFASHLGKYRSLVPTLALLFHLVDVAAGAHAGPVSLTALNLAVEWADFLEAHAKKLYAAETSTVSPAVTPPLDDTQLLKVLGGLGEKVVHGKLAVQTLAEAYRATLGVEVSSRTISERLKRLGLRDGTEKTGDGHAAIYWHPEWAANTGASDQPVLSSDSSESSESSDAPARLTMMVPGSGDVATEETEDSEESDPSTATERREGRICLRCRKLWPYACECEEPQTA